MTEDTCFSSIVYEEELTLRSGKKTWLTTLSPVIIEEKVVQIVGASRDITHRKKVEEEIFNEKEKLDIILRSIGDGVISMDNNHRISFMNAAAESICECLKEYALGRRIEEIVSIFDKDVPLNFDASVEGITGSETPIEIFNDYILTTRNSTRKRVSGKGAKLRDILGNVQGIVITIRDETERLKNQERITYLSMHDSLTGLYNRAYFDEELKRLDTANQLPISIIVGDANGLKLANDVFGHYEGDKLLINIARILKESCRYADIIARWGGDEFSIILPNTSNEDALQICRRIKEKCEISEPLPIKPSIALGTATKTIERESIKKVLSDAEEAMYKNKLIEGKKVRNEIISMLRAILNKRSADTIEHCNRLRVLAGHIESVFRLTEKEGEYLRILADIHDIGNISIAYLKKSWQSQALWRNRNGMKLKNIQR